MAPALTSDAALTHKGEKIAVSSETSGLENPFTPETETPTCKLKSVRNGRRNTNILNNEKRARRVTKQTVRKEALINGEPKLKSVTANEENILRVSKKMNPNNGSSKKDVTTSGRRTRAKSKNQKEVGKEKAMCGDNAKSVQNSDVIGVTNGNNRLHRKDKSKTPKTETPKSAEPKDMAISHSADNVSDSVEPSDKVTRVETPSLSLEISESVTPQSSEPTSHIESNVQDKCDTMTSRHTMLTRRASRLMSRIRRLQTRQVIVHSRQQIAGFVDQQKRKIEQRVTKQEVPPDSTLDLKDAQNMSTSALVNLVQKWQAQQPVSRRHPKQVLNIIHKFALFC